MRPTGRCASLTSRGLPMRWTTSSSDDYGDETTLASLTYGYVYDQPGEGSDDQVMTCGDYALVVNADTGYVSLLRRYLEPDIEAGESGPVVPSTTRSGVSVPERSWFQPTRTTGVGQSRGLELCPRIGSSSIPPFSWRRRRNAGGCGGSAVVRRPGCTPSSGRPRSRPRRPRRSRSGRSGAPGSIYRGRASWVLPGCGRRAGSGCPGIRTRLPRWRAHTRSSPRAGWVRMGYSWARTCIRGAFVYDP